MKAKINAFFFFFCKRLSRQSFTVQFAQEDAETVKIVNFIYANKNGLYIVIFSNILAYRQ